MQRVAVGQLSFVVAPARRKTEVPLISSVSVSGTMLDAGMVALQHSLDSKDPVVQLDHGEEVIVSIATPEGEVIGQARGTVAVSFADKVIEGVGYTVRQHKVRI
jgi:cell division protein YceG involved in septum cleavage